MRRGATVRVVEVEGGRRLMHRLAGVGIVPGASFVVTRPRGPALIAINGARVAIGRNAAMAVIVEETS